MTLFLVAGFLVLLLVGFPIFLTLIIPSTATLLVYFGHIPPVAIIQRMMAGVDKFALLAVPFFIFTGEIVAQGLIGRKLLRFSNTLVGHFYGGLALTTIVTCAIFGAISGAATAAIVAIGGLMFPAFMAAGYGEKFSSGIILASSTLAMLIPPGIAMILFAVTADVSIGQIFVAGVGVGIAFALALCAYSFLFARAIRVPLAEKASFRELCAACREAFWALGLPVIIIGGIYSGIFTPTEAAGVSAVYALFVEVCIYKQIRLREIYGIAVKTSVLVAMIYVLIAAGSVISWVMTVAQIPQSLVALLQGTSPILILLLINAVFLAAGMFIDPNSAIIVLVPLVLPLAKMAGIDLIHLGIVIVMNLGIGMLSPPFGLNLFVGTGVFDIPYHRIIQGIMPFILIQFAVLILVVLVPEVSLWLPRMLYGVK